LFPALPSGAQTLGLDETLFRLQAGLRWDPFFQSGAIIRGRHSAAFRAGAEGQSLPALVDGRLVLDLPAPWLEGGVLRFPEGFYNGVQAAFTEILRDEAERFRIAAIVIDPGHGGRDPGAIGRHKTGGKSFTIQEKDVNLAVSLELYSRLVSAFPDKRVLLTRSGDTFPSLDDRVNLAHSVTLADNEAIIFISIHANSSASSPDARGFEVYYLSPGYRRTLLENSNAKVSEEVLPILNAMLEEELTTESIKLAQLLLVRIAEAVGSKSPNRGTKEEEWFVVKNARMPSVLVELGFVTNIEDALLLSDAAYLNKLSDALYKGIMDFVAMFEQSGGFTEIHE
jgi:N-acetylmuramoyl-L-alanine amidase